MKLNCRTVDRARTTPRRLPCQIIIVTAKAKATHDAPFNQEELRNPYTKAIGAQRRAPILAIRAARSAARAPDLVKKNNACGRPNMPNAAANSVSALYRLNSP